MDKIINTEEWGYNFHMGPIHKAGLDLATQSLKGVVDLVEEWVHNFHLDRIRQAGLDPAIQNLKGMDFQDLVEVPSQDLDLVLEVAKAIEYLEEDFHRCLQCHQCRLCHLSHLFRSSLKMVMDGKDRVDKMEALVMVVGTIEENMVGLVMAAAALAKGMAGLVVEKVLVGNGKDVATTVKAVTTTTIFS
jgi:hypothetical protein